MNAPDYDRIADELLREARTIEVSKRPGYTIGDADVLANFKRVAERTGVTVGQVWLVYFLKHIDAITSIMAKPDLPVSEAPLGRFADAVNYLRLGWALHQEHSSSAGRIAPTATSSERSSGTRP